MSCGRGGFISHPSAAFVWGMRKMPPPLVEASIVGPGCRWRKGMTVHRIKAIDRRELRKHERLWVSSPARAVLEVAVVGTKDELVDVIDQGLALRRFTPGDLKFVLARKALLRLGRDAGLPMPETNVKFGPFEADFVWHKEKVIVELDSATYHSGPGVFHRDHEKDLVFRTAGFDVMRPTRALVVYQGPRVLVLLVQALSR